jgi:glycine cleavage system aminomethyltransferase T
MPGVWLTHACGAGVFDSLHLEKGRRLRGWDVHSEYKPYEVGLERTVRLDKGYFLGRDVLLKRKIRCGVGFAA